MTYDQQQALAALLEHTQRQTVCYLCSAAIEDPQYPGYTGLFVPNAKFGRRIGQPKGKQRVLAYKLCDRCYARPDREGAVEAHILELWGVQ